MWDASITKILVNKLNICLSLKAKAYKLGFNFIYKRKINKITHYERHTYSKS